MSNPESTRRGVIAVSKPFAIVSVVAIALLVFGSVWILSNAGGRAAADSEVIQWVEPLRHQANTVDLDVVDADRTLRIFIMQGKREDAQRFDRKRAELDSHIKELQDKAKASSDADVTKGVDDFLAKVSNWHKTTGDVMATAREATLDSSRLSVVVRLGGDDLIDDIHKSHDQLNKTLDTARENLLKQSSALETARKTALWIAIALATAAALLTLWLAARASRRLAPMTPSIDLGMLRAVLDQLPDGIAIYEQGGRLLVSNLAAARVVESPDGGRGLALFDDQGNPVPEEGSPLTLALAGHHVYERELLAERLDGSLAPVEVRAEPVLDSGQTTAAVIVLHDKGDEKRVESDIHAATERAELAEANLAELARRLRAAEAEIVATGEQVNQLKQEAAARGQEAEARGERFLRVVDGTHAVGVAFFQGAEFRLASINEKGLELLGERRRARDVRGSTLSEIVPGAEPTGLLDLFKKVAASGEPYTSEEYYSQGLRHGAAYWKFSLVPLDTESGKPAEELLLIGLDITDEVEQRATVAATKAATANWQIEDVLLAISNDLRTPVLSIQGMVDLFRQKYAEAVPDVTALHYLELTQRNADQMAQLIDDLVNLSKIGTSETNVMEIPLAAAVEEAWRASPRTGIELRVAGPLPTVRADRQKLLRALRDLFDTAARYRRDGSGAWMHVRVRDLGQHWEIEVTDNGRGFAPEEAETLFGPLAHRSTAAHNGGLTLIGSGIGLAAVRRVAELHGGAASAKGTPGEGAVYEFTIAK